MKLWSSIVFPVFIKRQYLCYPTTIILAIYKTDTKFTRRSPWIVWATSFVLNVVLCVCVDGSTNGSRASFARFSHFSLNRLSLRRPVSHTTPSRTINAVRWTIQFFFLWKERKIRTRIRTHSLGINCSEIWQKFNKKENLPSIDVKLIHYTYVVIKIIYSKDKQIYLLWMWFINRRREKCKIDYDCKFLFLIFIYKCGHIEKTLNSAIKFLKTCTAIVVTFVDWIFQLQAVCRPFVVRRVQGDRVQNLMFYSSV